ncbi:hypothetical protein CDN99_15160 [Roseateles aquatilis]|jgi:hypothetical protein|uniref:Pyocin activator protein PrtN n=1 Tax=Roseateles aquatilis TaxID=431061 RepID=A0A246J863_9BURK|nr:pyocin activator PrtN family protein [Roseateles aquatilis]MBY0368250.1 pyocin activator PrtN family protein [Burkholderiaceae bacterium]OWQ88815.1 hypothetical protein CDN99_15160 [Roseateles aquatilis]
MITSLALMSIYGAPAVPLERICEEYLGLSRNEAMRKAAVGELPLPVFRLAKSQKAPYLVSLDDLAKLIDDARVNAEETWKRCQV